MAIHTDWKQLYLKAIFESESEALPKSIIEAQDALHTRFQELRDASNDEERNRVERAMRMLELLRVTQVSP